MSVLIECDSIQGQVIKTALPISTISHYFSVRYVPCDWRSIMNALVTATRPPLLNATWGLIKCRVPLSPGSGAGIKLAVLDTGMDLGHPDLSRRVAASQTFVGQPVQDLHSHGTHCIGTSCGRSLRPRGCPGATTL